MITVDSELGTKLGFTSDKFSQMSYLWEKDNAIWFSMIAKNTNEKGVVKGLIKKCEENGYAVKVPTPFPVMEMILTKEGFVKTIEVDDLVGPLEVWINPPRG